MALGIWSDKLNPSCDRRSGGGAGNGTGAGVGTGTGNNRVRTGCEDLLKKPEDLFQLAGEGGW